MGTRVAAYQPRAGLQSDFGNPDELSGKGKAATCSVVSELLCSLAPTRWPNPKPAE